MDDLWDNRAACSPLLVAEKGATARTTKNYVQSRHAVEHAKVLHYFDNSKECNAAQPRSVTER
jgi:hypothetical protein